MDKDKKLAALERIVAHMIEPLKDVPFDVVVKALSGHRLIPFDEKDPKDIELKDALRTAILDCTSSIKKAGVNSRRANEVGNMMERPVISAIQKVGLKARIPATKSGAAKATGYPDILVEDRHGRPTYLEVKTFNKRNVDTTQRSFYLSPSEDFKVTCDARHLLLAFEMNDVGTTQISGETLRVYKPSAYKLVALDELSCDVKYEFNSDNRRLYAQGHVILDEAV